MTSDGERRRSDAHSRVECLGLPAVAGANQTEDRYERASRCRIARSEAHLGRDRAKAAGEEHREIGPGPTAHAEIDRLRSELDRIKKQILLQSRGARRVRSRSHSTSPMWSGQARGYFAMHAQPIQWVKERKNASSRYVDGVFPPGIFNMTARSRSVRAISQVPRRRIHDDEPDRNAKQATDATCCRRQASFLPREALPENRNKSSREDQFCLSVG